MKMRKMFAVILASALAVSLFAGCGSQKEETKVTPQETAAASSSAPAEAAETKEASAAAQTQTPEATEAPEKEVTAESLMKENFEKLGNVQSMQYNMILDVAMNMNVFGQASDVKMNMDVTAETFGDNGYMKGTMKSDAYGEESTESVEQYIMLEDGKYVAYSRDEDSDEWSKFETETPPFSKDMIPQMDSAGFTLETVTENGTEQYKASGSVDLKTMFEQMGKSFEEMLSGMMSMGQDDFEGTADVAYYFNKETEELEAVEINMGEALEKMFLASFESMFEGQETENGEQIDIASMFSVSVDSFIITLKDIKIDQGKEIVLPEEAKNAELSDDEEEFFSGEETTSEGGEQELSVELAESFDFKDDYFKFTCAGQEYTIGTTRLSEVLASGALSLNDEEKDKVIEAEGSDFVTVYINDENDNITFYVRNDSAQEKPIGDCLLYGVELSAYEEDNEGYSVAGLTSADTLEDVMAKLGNPTYGYETEFFRSYDWESKNYESVSVSFSEDNDDDTAVDIRVIAYNW